MKAKTNWDLILRYLDGQCSQHEREKVQEWLVSNTEHQRTLDQLQKIWDTPETRLPKPDVEKALMDVSKRAGIHTGLSKENADNIIRFRVRPASIPFILRFPAMRVLRIAAAVAFILTASYFAFKLLWPSSMKEVVVARGEQRVLTLPDETRVTLDSGSHFRFVRSFQDRERTVFLNGECYFEVTADQTRPFVIHTDGAVVTVLGTRFNVRAWRQNKNVVVAVVEGEVLLRSESDPMKEAAVSIEKGQMSQLRENGLPTRPESTNVDEHLGWLQQEMLFQSAPLWEVLDQLERWYDLEFVLSDTSYAKNSVTVFIEKKSIDDILDMLALVNNFKYEREGNKVTFLPSDSI